MAGLAGHVWSFDELFDTDMLEKLTEALEIPLADLVK